MFSLRWLRTIRSLRPRTPRFNLLPLKLWKHPLVEQVPLEIVVHAVYIVARPRFILAKTAVLVPHEHVKVRKLVDKHILEPDRRRIQRVRNGSVVRVDICHHALEFAGGNKLRGYLGAVVPDVCVTVAKDVPVTRPPVRMMRCAVGMVGLGCRLYGGGAEYNGVTRQ